MQPTESIQFTLPASIIASMNKAVEAGQYPSSNDVVLAALVQWEAWHEQPLQNIEELRALCEEGLNSGIAEPFTIEELLAELKSKK